MSIDILPIAEGHIEGFHAALDVVARERAYLAFLEAPPIEETRKFVARNIAKGYPQLVALDGDRVVGWCDVLPIERPVSRHCGVLGLGLLPAYRGRGLGERLMRAALQAARGSASRASSCPSGRTTRGQSHSTPGSASRRKAASAAPSWSTAPTTISSSWPLLFDAAP